MVTTSSTHVAVFTIEKIIPSLATCHVIRLLPRSAAGQTLSYLSLITGTRKPGEATGAKNLHIVLLDNGRTEILGGDFREILKCIRCSACLNVCPVYRVVGGHAYGSTYSGPMGIVLTELLDGMDKAHPLVDATTLCGACVDVCPVRVPLLKLLKLLRERRVSEGFTSPLERATMAGYALATKTPALFNLGKGPQILWAILSRIAARVLIDSRPATRFREFPGVQFVIAPRPGHKRINRIRDHGTGQASCRSLSDRQARCLSHKG
jgi:L-lactate dehydrogenase complex protein LldF